MAGTARPRRSASRRFAKRSPAAAGGIVVDLRVEPALRDELLRPRKNTRPSRLRPRLNVKDRRNRGAGVRCRISTEQSARVPTIPTASTAEPPGFSRWVRPSRSLTLRWRWIPARPRSIRCTMHVGSSLRHSPFTTPIPRAVRSRCRKFSHSPRCRRGAHRVATHGVDAHRRSGRTRSARSLRTIAGERFADRAEALEQPHTTPSIAVLSRPAVAPLAGGYGNHNAFMTAAILSAPTSSSVFPRMKPKLCEASDQARDLRKMRYLMEMRLQCRVRNRQAGRVQAITSGQTGTSGRSSTGDIPRAGADSFTAIIPADNSAQPGPGHLDEIRRPCGNSTASYFRLECGADRWQGDCSHCATFLASSRASICRLPTALFFRHREEPSKA